MAVDLTKLSFHSGYPAYKNNNVYTGTLTVTGSTSGGLNTRTFNIPLDEEPDLLDILFQGPSDGSLPSGRPTSAWFKGNDAIAVPTNDAGGGDPSFWLVSTSVSGSTVTVTLQYVQQFSTSETLTSTDFQYRIVDYSVFDT